MADYTIKHLTEVADVLGDYPGEMRMMTADLECEQVAFTHRRMPQHTGGKGSYGHRHKTQEEIYFVDLGKAPVQARRRRRRRRAWHRRPGRPRRRGARSGTTSPRTRSSSSSRSGSRADPRTTPSTWRTSGLSSAQDRNPLARIPVARRASGRFAAACSRDGDRRFTRAASSRTSRDGLRHCSWNAGPRGPSP